MRAKGTLKGMAGRYWNRLVLGACAAALLTPVPALGLVFQGSWNFVTSQVAAPAPVTQSRDNVAGAATLDIDMGFNGPNANGPVASSSFITATRQFRVAQGSEQLNALHAYETLLQGGSLSAFIYVKDLRGIRTQLTPPLNQSASVLFARLYAQSAQGTMNLQTGDYTLIVRLKYRKNRLGLWDNSLPRPGSPHHFVFNGL
jgi:hypothetical protein